MIVLLSTTISTSSLVQPISASIDSHFAFRLDFSTYKALEPTTVKAIINKVVCRPVKFFLYL